MSKDSNNKKHPILDRFQMRDTGTDMKNVLQGKGDYSVTYRLALVVGEGLFLAAFIFFIFRIIVNPFSILTLISLVAFIGYLVIFFVVGIITKETDGFYSRIVVCIAFTLMLPLIWFYSGGFEGAGPV